MADVIKQLKTIMPDLKTVSYSQDNAGCYHSGSTNDWIFQIPSVEKELVIIRQP